MNQSRHLLKPCNTSTGKSTLQVIAKKIHIPSHNTPCLKYLPETSAESSSENYIDSNVQLLLTKDTTPSLLRKSTLTWRKQPATADPAKSAKNADHKRNRLIAFKESKDIEKIKPKSCFAGNVLFTQKVNETLQRLKTNLQQKNEMKKEEKMQTIKQESAVSVLRQPRNCHRHFMKSFDAVKRLKGILEKNKRQAHKAIKEEEAKLEVLTTRLDCYKRVKNASLLQRPATVFGCQTARRTEFSVFVPLKQSAKIKGQVEANCKISIGVNTDEVKGRERMSVRSVGLSEFIFLPEFL